MRLAARNFAVCVCSILGCALAACSHREPVAGAAPAASSAIATVTDASADAEVSPFPLPKEVVEREVNPEHLPVYDGPTGSVEGTIYVKGPAAPDVHVDAAKCPAAVDFYGKQFREQTPVTPGGPRPVADAVVFVVGYSGYYLPEPKPSKLVTIGQDCAYPSRSITLTFGQRLEVRNNSKFPFAPMIEGDSSPAVMLAAPFGVGEPIKLYPTHTGHMLMTDFMQPFVHEDIFVFRQPLHTTSGTDGHYRIDGLPLGKLVVRAAHAGVLSEAQAPVDVLAGVVQKVDLTLEFVPKVPKADETRRALNFR